MGFPVKPVKVIKYYEITQQVPEELQNDPRLISNDLSKPFGTLSTNDVAYSKIPSLLNYVRQQIPTIHQKRAIENQIEMYIDLIKPFEMRFREIQYLVDNQARKRDKKTGGTIWLPKYDFCANRWPSLLKKIGAEKNMEQFVRQSMGKETLIFNEGTGSGKYDTPSYYSETKLERDLKVLDKAMAGLFKAEGWTKKDGKWIPPTKLTYLAGDKIKELKEAWNPIYKKMTSENVYKCTNSCNGLVPSDSCYSSDIKEIHLYISPNDTESGPIEF